MKTYSLLQQSLDQAISREALEQAVSAGQSIARHDCARMHRECFGIFASGLDRLEAQTFQLALDRQGFRTDLVADEMIPQLPEPYTVQRLDTEGLDLIFTDAMGRDSARSLSEVTLIAGAFLTQTHTRSHLKQHGLAGHGQSEDTSFERQYVQEKTPEFRLDFFFSTEPQRYRISLTPNTAFFFRNEAVRFRHEAVLLHVMSSLASMLPPDRSNQGLKRGDTTNFYQNLANYEREIRWHFHRLKLA